MNWGETLLKLALAIVLGGLLGIERETQGKPAGLRTVIIVCLAATIYVVAARQAALDAGEPIEPARLMSGVAGGVGFLGAGLILKSDSEVRWLTTAATLWAAAGMGLTIGLGQYALACAGTAALFVVLSLLGRLEDRVFGRPTYEERDRPRRPRD